MNGSLQRQADGLRAKLLIVADQVGLLMCCPRLRLLGVILRVVVHPSVLVVGDGLIHCKSFRFVQTAIHGGLKKAPGRGRGENQLAARTAQLIRETIVSR